jgi:hypothetical protein
MKRTRITPIALALVAVLSLVLAACGPKETPGPVVLTVTGMVGKELALTDADLHAMDVVHITAKHPKNGAQEYDGVRLNDLLDQAQAQSGATTLVFTASDGFSAEIDLATVRSCNDCLIAFTDTAGNLLAVMPGQSSKLWVKEVITLELK